ENRVSIASALNRVQNRPLQPRRTQIGETVQENRVLLCFFQLRQMLDQSRNIALALIERGAEVLSHFIDVPWTALQTLNLHDVLSLEEDELVRRGQTGCPATDVRNYLDSGVVSAGRRCGQAELLIRLRLMPQTNNLH